MLFLFLDILQLRVILYMFILGTFPVTYFFLSFHMFILIFLGLEVPHELSTRFRSYSIPHIQLRDFPHCASGDAARLKDISCSTEAFR